MTDLTVTLAGMTLKNPVVAASGTFGFGHEYGEFYDLSELGGICAFQYNSGGNLGECMVFGKIAGENAAKGVA